MKVTQSAYRAIELQVEIDELLSCYSVIADEDREIFAEASKLLGWFGRLFVDPEGFANLHREIVVERDRDDQSRA